MNITVICNLPPPSGGAEILMQHLVRQYHSAGHAVSVATSSEIVSRCSANLAPEVYPFDTSLYRAGDWAQINFSAFATREIGVRNAPGAAAPIDDEFVRGLEKSFDAFPPDVIHYQMPVGKLRELEYVCSNRRTPWVATCHGLLDLISQHPAQTPDGLSEAETFELLGSAQQVVVVSDESKQLLLSHGVERVTHIPGGIDLEYYKPPTEPSRKGILYVGKANHNKGLYETLIAHVRAAAQTGESLYLAGRGLNDENIHENWLGLPDFEFRGLLTLYRKGYVHFLGELSPNNLRQQYQNRRVLVLPSHTEGLPLCILEALACGLPVIASDVGDISKVIVPGRNGILIPRADVNALTTALAETSRISTISAYACRESVLDYRIETTARRYLECFEDLVKNQYG